VIRAASEVASGFQASTEVCVIGSGAGGGVAAALLAEAGHEVLVLEEGAHIPRSGMTQREEQMYPLLYRDGGNQMTDDSSISVLQGRVLGGSTVVNMADVVPVPDAVLAHWAAHFGVDRYGPAEVREAAAACRAVIGANRIQPGDLNRANSLLLEGGQKIGMSGAPFEHNRVGCARSGYCLIGCAYDAKRSVALTWIPRALATGRVLVQTEARVERLEHARGVVRAVSGSLVVPQSGRVLAPFRVEARRFVLAAGAIHSPLLLLRSGLGGSQVGRNLSLQPQLAVGALFPDPVVMFRGIPQAAYLDSEERATEADGLGGFRLETVSATPGMIATTLPASRADMVAMMRRLRDLAGNLCLVPDRPSGRVTASGGRPKISYTLTPEVQDTLRRAMVAACRVWLAAGADAALVPLADAPKIRSEADLQALARVPLRLATTPLISAHPQGTCRMGPDPKRAVVGLDLKVYGTDNLWVHDASVFPTTSSSHTMLPVMSYAWLAARDMG